MSQEIVIPVINTSMKLNLKFNYVIAGATALSLLLNFLQTICLWNKVLD